VAVVVAHIKVALQVAQVPVVVAQAELVVHLMQVEMEQLTLVAVQVVDL
jgi:hypothetical protein